MRVLIVSGIPTLLAAWGLLSPATLYSKEMTQDLLFNLSGAWQVYMGQLPHVDYHDPVGRLNFILSAIGFHLLGTGPFAVLVNIAIVTGLLFVASFVVAVRRLPLLPAVVFILFSCLLALAPTNFGDPPDQYTFAMSYNRYGWSAYSILALALFVAPQSARHDYIDLAVAGGLLAMVFFLKITYFGAGLATIGFAVLVQPHIRRRWLRWVALSVVLIAGALAPYNRSYLFDILSWIASGAVRTSLLGHFNNFLAGITDNAPYLAALVVAIWMWLAKKAPYRLPLTLCFLLAASQALLTQNSQTVGTPPGIVVLLILYDHLRHSYLNGRGRDIEPVLLTLVVFPVIAIIYLAAIIVEYHVQADAQAGLYVVDHSQLAGLAVPEGSPGTFLSFSKKFDYPGQAAAPGAAPRYQLTDHEYLLVLLEAVDLLEGRPPGGIALFDSVNPLPFMLGWKPSRGANLWSAWNAPLRPASEYLGEVRYVLVPKFSLTPQWTDDLLRLYRSDLNQYFRTAAETPAWTLLIRAEASVL